MKLTVSTSQGGKRQNFNQKVDVTAFAEGGRTLRDCCFKKLGAEKLENRVV